MEETSDDRAKAMAASASANAEPNRKLTAKAREEGELLSSDDDENIVSSVAQSSGTAASPGRYVLATVTNKYAQGTQTAKTVSGNNLSSSVDIQSRTSIQPINQKTFEKNRVTFKAGNPGWFPASGSNNNLVISFSDDDSGSDSEYYRQEHMVANKSSKTRVDGNGKLPAPSVVKLNKSHQNPKNLKKVMPKKLSSNRIFTSSMTKIHGGTNSRGAVPLSVEQGSQVRNLITSNKNLGSQERGIDHRVGLKNSKLQDLRQQIALRESELKLKAAQQNKDLAVASGKDYNTMNLSNEAVRNYQSTSAAIGQSEQKEPDKKRLKVIGSYSHQPTAVSHQEIPAAKSIMSVKEPILESSSLHDRNKISSQKDISISRIESSIVKRHKQDDKCVDALAENITRAVKDDMNSSGNQSDRNSKRVDHDVVVNQTAPLANVMSSSFPKNLDRMELNHPSNIGRHSPPRSFPNNATEKQNAMKSSDYYKTLSGDKTVDLSLHNIRQVNNASLRNSGGDLNVSGRGNMDIQSILDMEELLDKELEEAQEHRRRCEIEERNALKAYRKAQRALIEANVRCTKLYHQRELCSARFRSFILDESNLKWSSRLHEPVRNGLDLSNHITENMDLRPTSSHQMQPAYDGFNQQGYDSNIQCVTGAPLNVSYQHTNGQNLGSEPCSEPDASTSEPLPRKSKNLVHGLSSPSNELNVSADENEETFPLDHESGQHNFEDRQKEQISEGKQYNDANNLSIVGSKDSLLLEAALRSELFARLGTRTSKNGVSCYDEDPSVERGPDDDIGSDKMQTSNGSVPSSGVGQSQHHDSGGTDKPERMHETPLQIHGQCQAERSSLKFHSTPDSKENEFQLRVHHSATSALFSPPLVLRSVFGHLKVGSSVALSTSTLTGNQQNYAHNFYIGEGACVNFNETQDSSLIVSLKQGALRGYIGRETGSYTCNFAVDPFWPLCMYELRGKCNNDECPWQHVKDFSNGNMNQHQHGDSESADCQVGVTTCRQVCNGASKCHDILTPPMYIVGLDILKADSHSYESVVARRHGECWWMCFSFSLALSSMFQKELPVELLHTNDGRIEVHGSWNRQSSYFQSRDGVMNQLKQALPNNVQSVEMALLSINQEATKLEGIKKALSVLARALEADRTSEILWIVYLLIYHSNAKAVGKDDMFSYAVKHNEGSYALWLMYINSRTQLDDRLVAYDAALSALCCRIPASEGDEIPSACILDLVLQMLDCLCMSGNIEKAIQRISGLSPAAKKSNEPHSLLLSDSLTCLTVSDKLILWVCCVYLVIYRKLPDAIVQQFECEKELLAIEWPSIHLADDQKQRALKLVGTAVSFVESYIKSESLKNEVNLRSFQLFAICHVRCVVALDGLECSLNLLDKYIKLYPSCLELVLISVRLQKHDFGNLSFVRFEETLSKWPKEVPGIQCIWNQYAEHALRIGGPGFAKELMDRWFHSVWKAQHSQVDILDVIDGDISHGSQDLTSTSNLDFSVSSKHQMDEMFGLLNLSLYRLLWTDYNEAWLAIDRALKVAGPENFKHCVREHAMFLLSDKSGPKEDAAWQLNLLKRYLDNAPSFPNSEPLPRLFINNIDKPRVKQLIANLLSPISSDFSLVNLVLEVWYGPSLLPETIIKLKDLVDFVESIMEIVPSNYQLAFSVCKLLVGGKYAIDGTAASVLFWASSTLVSAIFHAVPIAPEYVWVEAADILGKVTGIETISERFYKRALSVYPFSIKLWKCYYNISNTKGDMNNIVEAAREKGIQLD